MAQLDEQSILDLGTTPIPGAEPCGSDVSEDEQYIVVTAEIAKRGRIEAEEPDWYRIESDGIEILRSKSKDAEIASAVGIALFKRCSYEGLAAALGLLTGLVRTFWDGMHPARPRRRKARMEGLTDLFADGGWFSENQPSSGDFDAIDVCLTRIEELKQALTERMPDDPPDFAKFIRGLKQHAGKRPAPSAPAAQPTAAAGAAPASGGGAAFAAPDMEDKAGAVNAILKAASFIRQADPTDAIAYAVNRIIKWSSMSMPASDQAKFQIPPPEASVLDALSHQFSSGLWDHLLNNAEAAFRSGDPLWLDLQRYVCSAMAGLGPQYDAARHTVMALTAGLVRRLGDGLFDLQFANGVSLCSGETKMWIESEVAGPQGSGGGAAGAGNGKLAEVSGEARKLAGSGKLKEGLQQLQDGLGACTERRNRFLWRLSIAQLCFESRRMQLASPLLEECYKEVQRFHVDEWEPSLAVEVAQTLYRCRKGILSAEKQATPEDAARVRDSFAWLCQLDPVAALAAEPAGK